VVEWCPQRPGVFASAGEDRLLCVWDLAARPPEGEAASKRPRSAVPPEMLFQHAGHKAPVSRGCACPAAARGAQHTQARRLAQRQALCRAPPRPPPLSPQSPPLC
jgi:hypothetical protein